MIPIISLLVILSLSLLVTRIATVALTFTGLSKELARFQARSAFTGVGFTTTEAERVVEHPVRRRIIMLLMLFGNAGIVTVIATLMGSFIDIGISGAEQLRTRLLVLILGLLVLWMIAISKIVDAQLFRLISWALKRWTRLEAHDYMSLLNLSNGYTVTEQMVEADEWVAGKNLAQLRLPDEGIQVLGIHRADGAYVGTPTGQTYLRKGDKLVIYGRVEHLTELDKRPAGTPGDEAHRRRVSEQRRVLQEQQEQDRP